MTSSHLAATKMVQRTSRSVTHGASKAEALKLNPNLSLVSVRFWDILFTDESIPESLYWILRKIGLPETAPSGN